MGEFSAVVEFLFRMLIWGSMSSEMKKYHNYGFVLCILQVLPKLTASRVQPGMYIMIGYTMLICPLLSTVFCNFFNGVDLNIAIGVILGMQIYVGGTMCVYMARTCLRLIISDNTYIQEKTSEGNHIL
jgi:hypothetical protein